MLDFSGLRMTTFESRVITRLVSKLLHEVSKLRDLILLLHPCACDFIELVPQQDLSGIIAIEKPWSYFSHCWYSTIPDDNTCRCLVTIRPGCVLLYPVDLAIRIAFATTLWRTIYVFRKLHPLATGKNDDLLWTLAINHLNSFRWFANNKLVELFPTKSRNSTSIRAVLNVRYTITIINLCRNNALI